jgi:hypothetical protein
MDFSFQILVFPQKGTVRFLKLQCLKTTGLKHSLSLSLSLFFSHMQLIDPGPGLLLIFQIGFVVKIDR